MMALITVIILLVVIRFALPARTPRIRLKSRVGSAKCVALLEKVRIGGSSQWVLERSENIENPIILFLHGGPGTSQLTMNRRNTRSLEQFFTVVNWDQRGAGKSYRAISEVEKMNVGQFVADAKELTLYLLKKFQKERIVLVGHSWGSVIGAMAASKYPELYSCYVGIGQAANMEQGERASYHWTLDQARSHNDRRAIRVLETIGPPPYPGDWQSKIITQRRYLGRFGGEYHGSRNGAFWPVITSLIFSREYGLIDRINFFRGILGSMKLLWPELLGVDLFVTVPEFKIPVFFMEGRFDHESPSNIAEKYFESIKAPSKELVWFERSAHMPNSEERNLFNNILIQKILPISRDFSGSSGIPKNSQGA